MLPAMHHACADTTGALWSSRTMMVRPLSSVVSVTPAGGDGVCIAGILAEKVVSLIHKLDGQDIRKCVLGKPIWYDAQADCNGQAVAQSKVGNVVN